MLEQAPENQWPEAWYIAAECNDQKATNKKQPNEPASVEDLKAVGICYWKLNADADAYPSISVPWNPQDTCDPMLSQLRDDRGYGYADIITVHRDKLPEYDSKVKSFFEEHIHDAEEIRYVLGGSGYFDVRDKSDNWIRIHVKKNDLITLPEGIYHRFTVDESDFIHAMRLFRGVPVWTPFNRPCDDQPSRKKFVDDILA
jgi:1,2-dihydroxy-3-keto-5-methylthiopentene dioxygenase